MKKAIGADGISMEAWRYGENAVKKGLIEVIGKVWKEGQIPADWRKSIIAPLYKRGDQEIVESKLQRNLPSMFSIQDILRSNKK